MSHEIVNQLKSLKLHGMAQTWPELVAQARIADFDPERFMLQLLKSETAEREGTLDCLPDERCPLPGAPGSERL